MLHDFLRDSVYIILSLVNRIIPKQKKIFFYGGSSLRDNTEALFRYCLNGTEYNIVCAADEAMYYHMRSGAKIIKASNFNVIRELLTSKVIVDSFEQRFKIKPTPNQLSLQLWHGTPLKSLDHSAKDSIGEHYSRFLYSSPAIKTEMMQIFKTQEKRMFLNSNPRCDDLFVRTDIPFLKKDGLNVIWMPTYRHGLGGEETKRDIPVLNNNDIKSIEDALLKRSIRLFIKPHPVQAKSFDYLLQGVHSDAICMITDATINEFGVPLYSLLGQMDALITDYSSVFFDYLLLDRPIGFAIDDMEEYERNRGFVFSNPLDYMPGERIYNTEDLVAFFDHVAQGQDDWKDERHRVSDLMNFYQDDQSCKRCIELIDSYLKD